MGGCVCVCCMKFDLMCHSKYLLFMLYYYYISLVVATAALAYCFHHQCDVDVDIWMMRLVLLYIQMRYIPIPMPIPMPNSASMQKFVVWHFPTITDNAQPETWSLYMVLYGRWVCEGRCIYCNVCHIFSVLIANKRESWRYLVLGKVQI